MENLELDEDESSDVCNHDVGFDEDCEFCEDEIAAEKSEKKDAG